MHQSSRYHEINPVRAFWVLVVFMATAITVAGFAWPAFGQESTDLTPEEQQYFITDLVMVHMIRNEFVMAPNPVNVRCISVYHGCSDSVVTSFIIGV